MRCALVIAVLAGCRFDPTAATTPGDARSVDGTMTPQVDAPSPHVDAGFAVPMLVQAKNPGFTAANALAVTLDLTAGDLLVAATYTSNLVDTLTVTDTSALTWTAATAVATPDEQQPQKGCAPALQIWYAPIAATGSDTVTLAQNNTNALGMELAEYSGIATATPVDLAGGVVAPASAATATYAITTTDRDVIVALFGDLNGTGTMAAGSGLTRRNADNEFYAMYADDVPGVPPGTYDLSATLPDNGNDNCWTVAALALRVGTQ
jgi:hypothetical protein